MLRKVSRKPAFELDDPVRLKVTRAYRGNILEIMDDGEAPIRYFVTFEDERAPESQWYLGNELEYDYLSASDEIHMEAQPTGAVIMILFLAVAFICFICAVVLIALL